MTAGLVPKVLADYRTAPIDARLKATLALLEKLTLTPAALTRDDLRAAREAGASRAALEDAITVCAAFCMIDRIADAVRFDVPDAKSFEVSAKSLLRFGYKL